jgi:hypothetical protein
MMQLLIINQMFWLSILSLISSNTSTSQKAITSYPMSNNTLILGLQWGDEGKGKIVDALAEGSEAVCRFQGGHNAGHTLKVDGEQKVLHSSPIWHPSPFSSLCLGQWSCFISFSL